MVVLELTFITLLINIRMNTTERKLNRMDVHLEYRDLPLYELQLEHLDVDLEYGVTYVISYGSRPWEIRYLSVFDEMVASVTEPPTYLGPFFSIRGFDPLTDLTPSACSNYIKDLAKKVLGCSV